MILRKKVECRTDLKIQLLQTFILNKLAIDFFQAHMPTCWQEKVKCEGVGGGIMKTLPTLSKV